MMTHMLIYQMNPFNLPRIVRLEIGAEWITVDKSYAIALNQISFLLRYSEWLVSVIIALRDQNWATENHVPGSVSNQLSETYKE